MRFTKTLMITIIILSLTFSGFIFADESVNLECKSAILMDSATGKVLYETNSHEKLEPASVTKIMTMLLAMEALDTGKITLQDKVIISKNVAKMKTGTRLMLEEGEIRTVEDLLYGVAVESGNDASIAIAECVAGGEGEFVKAMNKKAKEFGMNDTNFENPHGLHSENHKTSAHDIGIMSRELIQHEKIFDFISKYMVTVYVGRKNDVKRELVNKNKMVHFYKDVDGIKTGFTDEAMFCISVTAKNNNIRLVSVIMGAPDTTKRNRDARKLIDYGFANYVNHSFGKKGELVKQVKVNKGDSESVDAVFETNADILLRKGEEKGLEKIFDLPDAIAAPLKQGQKIGEITIKKDGEQIASFNIISDKDIGKASFVNNILRAIKYWFNYIGISF